MPEAILEHAELMMVTEALQSLEAPSERIAHIRATVERDLFGRHSDSFDIDKLAWLTAGISSSRYALGKMQNAKRFGGSHELLSFALSQVSLDGLFLEFGVFSGRTISHIARLSPISTIYGFDSFEGLPETWRPGFPKGAFSVPEMPRVPRNVELIPGWFDRTLPAFCDSHRGEKIAFLHVDCDLYSSTQTIFAQLKSFIALGTIIVFDEYFNYPGWEQHEVKAFKEFCNSNGVHYHYIGLVPHHQQVAVRIIG